MRPLDAPVPATDRVEAPRALVRETGAPAECPLDAPLPGVAPAPRVVPRSRLEPSSMSNVPSDLRYAKTHEWARREEDGTITVGITDHAQDALGDVVFVELPELDGHLNAGDEAGVVESVKAASDVYAPISGTVVAVNTALEEAPEQVNGDPYGEGWFFRLRPTDAAELEELLDAAAYTEVAEQDAH